MRASSKAASEAGMLFTVNQLSEYLQVPVQTIYAWRHEGGGPRALRAGRALRFRRSDVDEWLENRD